MTLRNDSFVKILKVFFVIWGIIWVNFIARDLLRKGYLNDYQILIGRDEEGKRSYTYGDYVFEFLSFCESSLPSQAGYELIGIEEGSLDSRRAIYYLYPHIKKGGADYLLVFNRPDFRKTGYILYKKLDNSRFILRRA